MLSRPDLRLASVQCIIKLPVNILISKIGINILDYRSHLSGIGLIFKRGTIFLFLLVSILFLCSVQVNVKFCRLVCPNENNIPYTNDEECFILLLSFFIYKFCHLFLALTRCTILSMSNNLRVYIFTHTADRLRARVFYIYFLYEISIYLS